VSQYVPDNSRSVAPRSPNVKSTKLTGGEDASMLLDSILTDRVLRGSALSIAVLAALVTYGAVSEAFIPAPIGPIANDLGTRYDSVYKIIGGLAAKGYVELSRLRTGRQRLLMRVVWPQTKPTSKKRGKNSKRG